MIVYIHNYFEFLSFLVCLFYIRKLKNSYAVSFLPYLLFITIAEICANNHWLSDPNDNRGLYILVCVMSYVFYSFIFFKFARSKLFKRVIYISGLFFTILAVSIIVRKEIAEVTYILLYTSIALTLFSCMYFYHIMKADDDFDDYSYIPGLWIASGVLIFYAGIIFCFSMMNYIIENDLNIGGVKLYKIIPRYLSIILYCCFSISFVVWKAQKKISSKLL